MKCPVKLSLLALALSNIACADEVPLYTGEEIVVTATRFRDTFIDRPVNVSVISKEDIRQSAARTVPELLSGQAGINTQDLFGNNAANTTVDLRGFGAAAKQNTLILLDGQRITDIDLSGVQWSAIPLASIERIEIVRGSGSVLYGESATTGVINIITKKPTKSGAAAVVSAALGSYSMRDFRVGASYLNADVAINVTGDRYTSDGYRSNNRDEQNNLQADMRWQVGHGDISLKLGADRQDLRLPGPRYIRPSIGLDELAADRRGTDTPLDYASRDGNSASVGTTQRMGWGELGGELAYRDKNQKSYFDQSGYPIYRDSDLSLLSFTPRIKLAHEALGKANTLVAGVDMHHWEYRLRTSNAPANIGQPINRVSASEDTVGLYFQNHTRLSKQTTLTLGLRGETMKISAQDVYDPAAPGGGSGSAAPNDAQRVSKHAYEIGLRHQFTAATAAYGRIGRSYRFANVDEIYESTASYVQQFQFLRPQTSNDREIGVESKTASYSWRTSLFHMDVTDEIHLDPYTAGIGNTNLPPSRRYGVELEGAWQPESRLALHANYTYTVARFREGVLAGGAFTRLNVDIAGKTVPLVPAHKLNLSASWTFDQGTRLNASLTHVGKQFMDNDEPNDLGVTIPAYTTVDLKLVHAQGPWTATAGINNLLNEKYYSYGARSQFTLDRYAVYPLPERNFSASLEYAF